MTFRLLVQQFRNLTLRRVDSDTVLYEHSKDRFFRIVGWLSLTPIVFGMYPANFVFHQLWKRDNQTPVALKLQVGLACVSSACAVSLSAVGLLFVYRNVRMLEALKGGTHIRITTYSIWRRKRSFVTALNDVVATGSSSSTVHIPGQVSLKVKGKLFRFLVDGQGQVHNRKLMNAIIAARRQW
ncbi:transmembrane protein 223-like [Corticium candelabrum]|uniref:transmembrane protein 223-like n=1 Tax=Corticium candelabrum TaxID=121492 RepID=UPI002E253E10|nr:transmembrane protein 223-like [Corticium candelabrum]